VRPTAVTRCARQAEQTAAPAPAQITSETREPTATPSLSDQSDQSTVDIDEEVRRWDPHNNEGQEPGVPRGAIHDDQYDMATEVIEVVQDRGSITNHSSTGVMARSRLLGRRQVPIGCGGEETGGCTVFNICAEGFCARVERMSCVQAFIHITMGPINSEVRLDVFEDGDQVCSVSVSCLTINTPGCLEDEASGQHDCGDGNRIEAWGNGLSSVDYVSSRTDDRHYFLYLGQDGGDQYYPCPVSVRFWSLCVDSDWSASDGLCRDTSALLERPGPLVDEVK
jgi:hypothetical protein